MITLKATGSPPVASGISETTPLRMRQEQEAQSGDMLTGMATITGSGNRLAPLLQPFTGVRRR